MSVFPHFDLLGYKVRDKVTGYEGVVTSLSFDLFGCIQVVIKPGLDKDGKLQDGDWFDVSRLELLSIEPVMDRPDFEIVEVASGKKGPEEKPIP